MKKRVWLLYGCLFTLFCGLAFRIYTISDRHLSSAAGKQASVTVTVANTRGTFYDRNGVALTNETYEYRASVLPSAEVLTVLSEVMDTTAFAEMNQTLQSGRPAVVQLKKPPAAKGITPFHIPIRYQKRVLAPHVLGYADADITEGLTGLEDVFDSVLSQYNGTATVTYTVDAHGNALNGVAPTVTNTISRSKGGVRLTLDATIQRIAEDTAAKYIQKGAVVILNPKTGEILAMASLPTYHPNAVADVLQDPDSPLLNRALCSYNCGSVFKLVSAAAALETEHTPDELHTCNGSITVADTVFHCHYRLGHGQLNMESAMAKSCNCYFIELMQQTGGEALWNIANRLKFDETISLAEGYMTKSATLPHLGSLSTPAALANLSFGQGELTATPVHIAQLISTIVNDGTLVSPYIVDSYVDENGTLTDCKTLSSEQVFSAQTAAALRKMMERVVTADGTGYAGDPIFGTAAAKTGTAETGWPQGETEKYPVVQSWFAGYYPADQPEYVIVVLGENADNTNAKTAPVFKEICEKLYQIKSEE